MTALLDDAAERRCQELLRTISWIVELSPGSGSNILAALQIAWTEATEAAALKCEKLGERTDPLCGIAYDRAAAAIRGGRDAN